MKIHAVLIAYSSLLQTGAQNASKFTITLFSQGWPTLISIV